MDIKKVGSAVSEVSGALSHFHTVFSLLSTLRGKDVPDNAPDEVKNAAGVLGIGDEIDLQKIFLEFEGDDLEILTGFIHYHFLRYESKSGSIIAWWQLNKWRTLVTKLDPPTHKTGTEETIVVTSPKNGEGGATTDANTKVTSTIKKDMTNGGSQLTLHFMQRIIQIVKKEEENINDGTKDSRRNTGYEKVITYFESTGIPTMPKPETVEWIEQIEQNLSLPKVTNWTKNQYNLANVWIDEKAEENKKREAAMPWWDRWLNKLL